MRTDGCGLDGISKIMSTIKQLIEAFVVLSENKNNTQVNLSIELYSTQLLIAKF